MKNSTQNDSGIFNRDIVLHATWLYYQEGLSQTDVAKLLGISRASVVKYLQVAREKGLVQIYLDLNIFSSIKYSIKIKEFYY